MLEGNTLKSNFLKYYQALSRILNRILMIFCPNIVLSLEGVDLKLAGDLQ